jgi:carbamoyl-phosphate synthase small subunit
MLEDGTLLEGTGHGTAGECIGEFVFNTAMTGYEEVVSDPSYRGQVVVFTTSHIGNTGITHTDMESARFQPGAFVCKEFSRIHDNHRAQESLEAYLNRIGKFAVSNIDTRFLTKHLREKGCLMGIVSLIDHNPESLRTKLNNAPRIENDVSLWRKSPEETPTQTSNKSAAQWKVAVIDFGIKNGIVQNLEEQGCQCHFFVPPFRAADIEAIQPDGLFLSNGPGDPRTLLEDSELRTELSKLVQKYPTFGICLGHQILGLLFGGKVDKLQFGHHAINHPVKVVRNAEGKKVPERVFITSQNHNYHVNPESIENAFFVTHIHGNDGTVAGMHHRSLPLFSVQFHPEANPGPHDAAELFSNFTKMMESTNASMQ